MQAAQIRVHASLDAAEADWCQPGLAGYAFQTLAWLRAWQHTMGRASRVRLALAVVAGKDGRVLLCLPLGVAARGGVRTLGFLGGAVTDYHAPLADPAFATGLDAASYTALWARIVAALPPHDVIRFIRMPCWLDPPAGAGSLPVPNPMALLPGVQPAGNARSLTLPASEAAFVAGLKTKFAADTRRRQRRMAEEGAVELHVGCDAAMLDTLFAMKSRRWQETRSKDWAADPSFRGFYAAMSSAPWPDGAVHGSVLTVGGTPVAAHWGVVYRARFYHLLLGWAAGDWMRFATGRQITDALIRQAIAAGVRVFDFTAGDEAYKADWADAVLPLLSYTAATTRRGRAALALHRALLRVRARAKAVRWLRRAVRRARGLPPAGDTSALPTQGGR